MLLDRKSGFRTGFWLDSKLVEVTKPYEFIGFGAMDATKPYKFIGLGAMDATKPYEFIGKTSRLALPPAEDRPEGPDSNLARKPARKQYYVSYREVLSTETPPQKHRL